MGGIQWLGSLLDFTVAIAQVSTGESSFKALQPLGDLQLHLISSLQALAASGIVIHNQFNGYYVWSS